MEWEPFFRSPARRIVRRSDLTTGGASGYTITSAVRSGALFRVRRDHYALPSTDRPTVQAVRVGGRLACVSALRDLGVFAAEDAGIHVHVVQNHSRSRSPRNRRVRLTAINRDGVELHWNSLAHPSGGTEFRVDVRDALTQAAVCQTPAETLASFDSALFLGLIGRSEAEALVATLPRRLRRLASRLEPRSESGPESVLRWWLLEAGIPFEVQVSIRGVGRVDFLIADVLVVEVDSRLAHASWEQQVRDRDRDLALATRQLMSLRPHYAAVMYSPQLVIAAIRGLLATR